MTRAEKEILAKPSFDSLFALITKLCLDEGDFINFNIFGMDSTDVKVDFVYAGRKVEYFLEYGGHIDWEIIKKRSTIEVTKEEAVGL